MENYDIFEDLHALAIISDYNNDNYEELSCKFVTPVKKTIKTTENNNVQPNLVHSFSNENPENNEDQTNYDEEDDHDDLTLSNHDFYNQCISVNDMESKTLSSINLTNINHEALNKQKKSVFDDINPEEYKFDVGPTFSSEQLRKVSEKSELEDIESRVIANNEPESNQNPDFPESNIDEIAQMFQNLMDGIKEDKEDKDTEKLTEPADDYFEEFNYKIDSLTNDIVEETFVTPIKDTEEQPINKLSELENNDDWLTKNFNSILNSKSNDSFFNTTAYMKSEENYKKKLEEIKKKEEVLSAQNPHLYLYKGNFKPINEVLDEETEEAEDKALKTPKKPKIQSKHRISLDKFLDEELVIFVKKFQEEKYKTFTAEKDENQQETKKSISNIKDCALASKREAKTKHNQKEVVIQPEKDEFFVNLKGKFAPSPKSSITNKQDNTTPNKNDKPSWLISPKLKNSGIRANTPLVPRKNCKPNKVTKEMKVIEIPLGKNDQKVSKPGITCPSLLDHSNSVISLSNSSVINNPNVTLMPEPLVNHEIFNKHSNVLKSLLDDKSSKMNTFFNIRQKTGVTNYLTTVESINSGSFGGVKLENKPIAELDETIEQSNEKVPVPQIKSEKEIEVKSIDTDDVVPETTKNLEQENLKKKTDLQNFTPKRTKQVESKPNADKKDKNNAVAQKRPPSPPKKCFVKKNNFSTVDIKNNKEDAPTNNDSNLVNKLQKPLYIKKQSSEKTQNFQQPQKPPRDNKNLSLGPVKRDKNIPPKPDKPQHQPIKEKPSQKKDAATTQSQSRQKKNPNLPKPYVSEKTHIKLVQYGQIKPGRNFNQPSENGTNSEETAPIVIKRSSSIKDILTNANNTVTSISGANLYKNNNPNNVQLCGTIVNTNSQLTGLEDAKAESLGKKPDGIKIQQFEKPQGINTNFITLADKNYNATMKSSPREESNIVKKFSMHLTSPTYSQNSRDKLKKKLTINKKATPKNQEPSKNLSSKTATTKASISIPRENCLIISNLKGTVLQFSLNGQFVQKWKQGSYLYSVEKKNLENSFDKIGDKLIIADELANFKEFSIKDKVSTKEYLAAINPFQLKTFAMTDNNEVLIMDFPHELEWGFGNKSKDKNSTNITIPEVNRVHCYSLDSYEIKKTYESPWNTSRMLYDLMQYYDDYIFLTQTKSTKLSVNADVKDKSEAYQQLISAKRQKVVKVFGDANFFESRISCQQNFADNLFVGTCYGKITMISIDKKEIVHDFGCVFTKDDIRSIFFSIKKTSKYNNILWVLSRQFICLWTGISLVKIFN